MNFDLKLMNKVPFKSMVLDCEVSACQFHYILHWLIDWKLRNSAINKNLFFKHTKFILRYLNNWFLLLSVS